MTVNTDVLPLATFSGVESAQLAAGIAPDLVFNQANYQPYMVVPLNRYLSKPNPFVAGNKSWLSEFDPSAFSAKASGVSTPRATSTGSRSTSSAWPCTTTRTPSSGPGSPPRSPPSHS